MSAFNISMTMRNRKKIIDRMRRLPSEELKLVAMAAHRESEFIMTEAKRRTPVMTGNLRASGHVVPPVFSPWRDLESRGVWGTGRRRESERNQSGTRGVCVASPRKPSIGPDWRGESAWGAVSTAARVAGAVCPNGSMEVLRKCRAGYGEWDRPAHE